MNENRIIPPIQGKAEARIIFNGVEKGLSEWAAQIGIGNQTMRDWLKKYSIEEAMTRTPAKYCGREREPVISMELNNRIESAFYNFTIPYGAMR